MPTRLIDQVLSSSRKLGADAAEADINTGRGLSVNVRMGQVETIEHQRDKGLGVTVYIGGRKGSSSTTDFSDGALEATVNAAFTIARHASQDDCAGLIDPEYLATDVPDLDLCHSWEITPQAAIELATECENAARRVDKRLTNSDGALVATYTGSHLYGNTHGFINGWDWSSHNIDCAVIAEENGRMQRDGLAHQGARPAQSRQRRERRAGSRAPHPVPLEREETVHPHSAGDLRGARRQGIIFPRSSAPSPAAPCTGAPRSCWTGWAIRSSPP